MISRLRTNTVEFATIIRGSVNDANSSTGTGPQSYCFPINYPGYFVNPASGITTLTQAPLLADEKAVFDEYRVVKVQVKYLPWVTGQVRVCSAVAFTAPSDPTLIMSVDYDDLALWSSNTKALNSQNPAMYHAYEPKMQVITMTQQDSVDGRKWLNFQAIAPSLTSPPDPNNPAKIGAIKVRKFGYQLTGTTEATFYVEWTVLLKGVYTLA